MIKLNDNNLAIGQIKQLLKDFNLPNCPVVQEDYEGNSPVYIKHQGIYRTADKQFIKPYLYNDPMLNLTTNLRIDNNLYDSYTHRYLGRYLRFLRDYSGIDLMSLYNCCDYTSANTEFKTEKAPLIFTSTEAHICYAIPITYATYTLRADTRLPAELCISSSEENDVNRHKAAEQSYCRLDLSKGVVLDIPKILPKALVQALHNFEKTLTLYIKLPASYQGSLVVLEGDFLKDYATANDQKQMDAFVYKPEGENSLQVAGFSVQPQLLAFYNTDKYLLADRLIQYLTGNVITPLSEPYDIKKLQDFLFELHLNKAHGGVWHPDNLVYLRKYIVDNRMYSKAANILNAHDILGYGDSAVEASLEILYPVEGGLDERYI